MPPLGAGPAYIRSTLIDIILGQSILPEHHWDSGPVCGAVVELSLFYFAPPPPPYIYIYIYIQWGKKVFSQPPIVQVLPLKKMREACKFLHRYTSTMRDKIRKKKTENHIVGFLNNLLANYGGK